VSSDSPIGKGEEHGAYRSFARQPTTYALRETDTRKADLGRLQAPTLDKVNDAKISIRLVPYAKVYPGGGRIHCSTDPLVRDPT
jgi:hypothetical protein